MPANEYYIHGGTPKTPPTLTAGISRPMRDEFNAIERGFDRLPVFSSQGSHGVVINGSNTGLTSTLGKILLGGTFTTAASVQFSGGFSVTFIVQAATTVTLPSVSGTLVTLSGPQTLTNKTLTAPGMNGIVTGTGVWNANVIAPQFGGTGISSYATGDLLAASGGASFAQIASGAAGSYFRSGAALPIWSTLILPNASAQGDLFISSVTNQMTTLAKNTTATRYLSNTGASNNPAWAQVNLANGVVGNLSVNHLNGGVATAFSLWRGDGVWASIPGNTDIFSGTKVFPSAGSFTWNVPASITRILVWLWGGGGGGCGGVKLGTLTHGLASTGGPNGYHSTPCIAFLTVTPGALVTITIGAGGAGGLQATSVGPPAGGGANGGDSTFVVGVTTLTAKGGIGGGQEHSTRAFTFFITAEAGFTYDHDIGGGDGPPLSGSGDVNSPGTGGTAGFSATIPNPPSEGLEDGHPGFDGACIIYY